MTSVSQLKFSTIIWNLFLFFIQVKRQTIYERPIGDDSSQSATPNANASGPKILRKEDVIKGAFLIC